LSEQNPFLENAKNSLKMVPFYLIDLRLGSRCVIGRTFSLTVKPSNPCILGR
jgi:hypothetical protein